MRASNGIPQLVRASILDAPSVVLAVSGGVDSMVLMDAAASGTSGTERARMVVATFDHATGTHATRAAAAVARAAALLGLPVVIGRAAEAGVSHSEAAWRVARWSFLRDVAKQTGGVIVTAHTRDDQVETVLMRALRGAGARGLAGLYAASPVRRPLLVCPRADIEAYARARALAWTDDPTNASPRFLRNRVRRELLPALRGVHPAIDMELLTLAERAATWRREMGDLVDASVRFARIGALGSTLDVVAEDLDGYPCEVLAVVWQELAARVGLALDRRGTDRLAAFTIKSQAGARMQLSGGWQVMRARDRLELRHLGTPALDDGLLKPKPLEGRMLWYQWSFTPIDANAERDAHDPWVAFLPADRRLRVRAWRPGDSMAVRVGDGFRRRKVKDFLSDAGISGHNRARWPVILSEDEIVWIPGVRRYDAETARSGGPVLTYLCELLDR